MNKKQKCKILNTLIIILMLIITISGVSSFDAKQSYYASNQYGESIQMWGSGVYAHDSYFKAPIFVGSDFTILAFVLPFAVVTFFCQNKYQSMEYYIRSFGLLSLLLYYSASLVFGVTYNGLHLIYIAFFSVCFFESLLMLIALNTVGVKNDNAYSYPFTKGMKIFLLLAGIALFVAWLPDIILSLSRGCSLELIEVYTTEITYVLDMGIISPLIFITYYLAKNQKFIGYVLLRMIFKVCIGVGIMLPIQSVFQLMAGISIPIPALMSKVIIFVILAVFAVFFERQLKYCRTVVEKVAW